MVRRLLPLLLIILLSLPACTAPEEPRPFTIALTGYLMGQLGPCHCPAARLGGLDRRAGMLEEELPKRDGVLMVDAGKFMSLEKEDGAVNTEATIAALTMMGVQAIHAAHRDARLGKAELMRLMDEYDAPLVSCNMIDVESGELVLPAYRKVQLQFEDGGRLTVAVIGVSRASSHSYQPEDLDLGFRDPEDALVEAVREVKDVPVIVLLTDSDRSMCADWLALVEEQTGRRPDMILSSNLHPPRSSRVLIGQTPMTTAGRQGKYLDLVEAVPMEGGGWDMRKETWRLDEDTPVSQEVRDRILAIAGDDAFD